LPTYKEKKSAEDWGMARLSGVLSPMGKTEGMTTFAGKKLGKRRWCGREPEEFGR